MVDNIFHFKFISQFIIDNEMRAELMIEFEDNKMIAKIMIIEFVGC